MLADLRWTRLLLGCWILAATLGGCKLGRAEHRPEKIVVGGYVNHEAVHQFAKASGHQPTRQELLSIHRVWIDNEVLYREGKKLPLAAGEASNRERVIEKQLEELEKKLAPQPISDAELARWFERHRDKYQQPARFDFEDAALPGPSSEPSVRALVERLNQGHVADAAVRAFHDRPESNLVQSYGAGAARELSRSEPGQWRALLTRDGWRAMRLQALKPGQRASFEAERAAIRRDWAATTVAELRPVAVRALWNNYEIEFAKTHDCLADQ